MNITKIKLIDTELTDLIEYYIYNVDVLKGKNIQLRQSRIGLIIDCDVKMSNTKFKRFEADLKHVSKASSILHCIDSKQKWVK